MGVLMSMFVRVVGRHGDEVEASVAHAGFGRKAAGERDDVLGTATDHDALDAFFVRGVHVHGGDDLARMLVLVLGHAHGELALVVVVGVAEHAHAFG